MEAWFSCSGSVEVQHDLPWPGSRCLHSMVRCQGPEAWPEDLVYWTAAARGLASRASLSSALQMLFGSGKSPWILRLDPPPLRDCWHARQLLTLGAPVGSPCCRTASPSQAVSSAKLISFALVLQLTPKILPASCSSGGTAPAASGWPLHHRPSSQQWAAMRTDLHLEENKHMTTYEHDVMTTAITGRNHAKAD